MMAWNDYNRNNSRNDVTDGSVENYDFLWEEETSTASETESRQNEAGQSCETAECPCRCKPDKTESDQEQSDESLEKTGEESKACPCECP